MVRAPISAQEGANFGSGGRYQCLARMAKCYLVFVLTRSRDLNPPKLRYYFRYSRRKLRRAMYGEESAGRSGGRYTLRRAPTGQEDAI